MPRSIVLIVGGSLLLAVILLFDIAPFLRGGEILHWQWPYNPGSVEQLLGFAVQVAAYVVAAIWLIHHKHVKLTLALSLLMTVSLSLMIVGLRHDDVLGELLARTLSTITTGQHSAAAEIDWSNDPLRQWTTIMEGLRGRNVHVALSPPGLPLLQVGINRLLDAIPAMSNPLHLKVLSYQCHNFTLLNYTPGEWASAWVVAWMPLWAGLAIFPLYAIARRLIPERALWVVAWWALIPALLMYAPTWNTFYPLVALVAFWLLLKGLDGRGGWLIVSGVVTGLLTFANLSTVPLAGLFGFYVLLNHYFNQRETQHWSRPIIVGLWFGVGIIIVWGLFWIASGLTPLDIIATAFDAHLALDRPYLPWLVMHFWEWALLAGIPLIALWLMGAFRRQHILPIALLLTIAILLLSNTARGETGRVWLFFAPFMLLAAAQSNYETLKSRSSISVTLSLITIAQAALLVAVAGTWDVIAAADMDAPPSTPPALALSRPADARFDDRFRLVAWDAVIEDDSITLNLNWQADSPITTPYWFAVLLVTPDGTPAGESIVWQPFDTHFPTTCWPIGEIVGDSITLPLPDDAPSGDYWVSLVAFANVDNPSDTLPVFTSVGEDTQLGLGPIEVSN